MVRKRESMGTMFFSRGLTINVWHSDRGRLVNILGRANRMNRGTEIRQHNVSSRKGKIS